MTGPEHVKCRPRRSSKNTNNLNRLKFGFGEMVMDLSHRSDRSRIFDPNVTALRLSNPA
jgi:hypothetical protein